jgi:hypothetical protein
MRDHRKIIYYYAFRDQYDDIEGHGTHVCGIAAGNHYDSNSYISRLGGMARDSKIFFMDIGKTNPDGTGDHSFDISFNKKKFFKFVRYSDSKIVSNSWGFPFNISFDSLHSRTKEYDEISFQNPQFLQVFPAGNDGEKSQNYTIRSPGTSKNVLTVGALTPSHPQHFTLITNIGNISASIIDWKNDPYIFTLYNPPSLEWDIVYDCNTDEDIYGKAAFFDDDPSYYDILECWIKGINFFLLRGTNIIYSKLWKDTPFIHVDAHYIPSHFKLSFDFDHKDPQFVVDKYSSRGPTYANRIKPEVVASGTILSAKSYNYSLSNPYFPDDYRSILLMSGTSMDTPVVSGTLVLIDDYFRHNNYLGDSQQISGSLIKAIAINSAKTDLLGFPNLKSPNYSFGYGIPNLAETLLFSPNRDFGFRVLNEQRSLTGSHQQISIKITNQIHDLSISIVWFDSPLDEYQYPLTVDFDIILVDPNGFKYYGNGFEFHDQFNTNEKIFVPANEIILGEYILHILNQHSVHERYLSFHSNITYSLAINGPFDHSDISLNPRILPVQETSQCIDKCSNHGICSNGFCQCDSDYHGDFCQLQIETINNDQNITSILSFQKTTIYKL